MNKNNSIKSKIKGIIMIIVAAAFLAGGIYVLITQQTKIGGILMICFGVVFLGFGIYEYLNLIQKLIDKKNNKNDKK